MKLIAILRPDTRLADINDVKLAFLELGYEATLSRRGDLIFTHPRHQAPSNVVPWPSQPHPGPRPRRTGS
jgi:hypothetical protein